MECKLKIFTPLIILLLTVFSCASSSNQAVYAIYKGVYTSGPEVRSFKDCDSGHEYWVTDHSEQLEPKYIKINTDKTYMPVYLEVEAEKVKSGRDGKSSEFDSTLVVRKVIKITRDIPQDMCN